MKLINSADLAFFLPELVLVGALLLGLVLDLVLRERGRRAVAAVALLGLAAATALALEPFGFGARSLMQGMVLRDDFAVALKLLAGISAALVVLFAAGSAELDQRPTAGRGEFYLLILGAAVGMFLLAGANNLLMLYLSMELLSLPSYLLAGWAKRSSRGAEAGIKYIVYGAGASCAMIYGISLLYGLSGSLSFEGVRVYAATLGAGGLPPAPFLMALGLVLCGFFFKVAAFPFFQWAPDVYQGAPTPVTAFLAVGSKTVGMGALLRFIFLGLCDRTSPVGFTALSGADWPLYLAAISALTMTAGNLVALVQSNVKRLLAYSSIAHAGYLLMAIPTLSVAGLSAVLFYLAIYLTMNLGAFFVVILLENQGIEAELRRYHGLGRRAPLVAVAMAVFMFSLTGLPPLAGFLGKFYLFAALVQVKLFWLAVVGVLNSVVSLYYYVGVVKPMFLGKSEEAPVKVPASQLALLIALALFNLGLIVYWSPLKVFFDQAGYSLGWK